MHDFRGDLARYGSKPFLRELSVYAVAVYRFGQWCDAQTGLRGALLRRMYWGLHRAVISVTHVEIPKEATIGPGLRIHHNGPVVIHPEVMIGRDCSVRHGVTLGERRSRGGVPTLGDGVELGAYSQVLGPVRIGHGARIGAMALVTQDVPAGGTALAPRAEIRGPQ